MTTTRSFTFVLAFAVLFVSPAVAQQQRRTAVSPSEKVARARWQPVRQASVTSGVKRAQNVEPIPAPAPDRVDVMPENDAIPMNVVDGEYYYDGEIIGPDYGDSMDPLACDAMGCAGDCDGCDSIGCSNAHHGNGWSPCLTLCFPQDGWVSLEYLNWQQKGMYLPPLVRRGTTRGDNPAGANSALVYGDTTDHLEGTLDGLRLNVGLWLDRCHEWSVSADYFGWDPITANASFVSNGNNSIGRPIFNIAEAGAPLRAQLIDFNGLNNLGAAVDISGALDIRSSSELKSGGFQFRRFLVANAGCGDTVFLRLPQAYRSRVDLGIGYRYTQLNEGLSFNEELRSVLPLAGTIDLNDSFDTRTQFNGFDFGIYYTRQRGLWNLDLKGRFGLGTNHQQVRIHGDTSINGAAPVEGGLLALSSNIGDYSRDRFSVLPEFGATLGYQVTPRLRATVGYTFMYWSNVVRPGDQIDLNVNQNLVPLAQVAAAGQARPEFRFRETDYWAQGVSFGGEFRW